MIVCHCTGVREREIRRLVRNGKRSSGQVARESGAGACCGGCRPEVARIVACETRRMGERAAQPKAPGACSCCPSPA